MSRVPRDPDVNPSTDSRHRAVVDALAQFVQAACNRLGQQVFPRVAITRWRFEPNGTGSGNPVEVIAPATAVSQILNELELWAAYQNLVKCAELDPRSEERR